MSLRSRSRAWHILVFVGPALLIYGVFLVYPLVGSLVGSLYQWDGLDIMGWSGTQNFRRLLSPPFRQQLTNAFTHNCIWFAGIMILENGLGLLLAYLLYQEMRGHKLFRAALFVPATLSPIVVGALWRLLLHPTGGIINKVLVGIGLGRFAMPWLGLPNTALPVLILVDTWNWIGFPIMVFLAAMNDIPPEILEASRLDGATRWQQFRMIMFPLMWPSITTISILTFINTFNQFDVVYIMQGLIGNPMYSTDVLGTMFYRLAFGSQGSSGVGDTGMALSIATLMLIFIGAGTLFMLRMMQKRRVNY